MKDFIYVDVTENDLRNNRYVHNTGCPLYQALNRKGYPVTYVGGDTVKFGSLEYAILDYYELADAALSTKEPLRVHLIDITPVIQEG